MRHAVGISQANGLWNRLDKGNMTQLRKFFSLFLVLTPSNDCFSPNIHTMASMLLPSMDPKAGLTVQTGLVRDTVASIQHISTISPSL